MSRLVVFTTLEDLKETLIYLNAKARKRCRKCLLVKAVRKQLGFPSASQKTNVS